MNDIFLVAIDIFHTYLSSLILFIYAIIYLYIIERKTLIWNIYGNYL